jgi:hypothetical protein
MNRVRFLAVALTVVLVDSGQVRADFIPLITVDENGAGTLLFPGVAPIPTVGVLAPDPGPGGLALALTYNLLGPPGLVAGDVLLLRPGTAVVSDVIRFNPAGTGSPGYPASLVFYSDADHSGVLADTGFPTAFHANVIVRSDDASFYTPNDSQPGFVPGGFQVTYQFMSETSPVPEPASLISLVIGGVTLGAFRLRKQKSVA